MEKHSKRVAIEEEKALTPDKPGFLEEKANQIVSKIPPKALAFLESAFEKGFILLFEKGSSIIEKTCSIENRKAIYQDIDKKIDSTELSHSQLSRLDWQSKISALYNVTFSTAEGAVLGILGIGIPDIPIVIGVILKSLYETCINYGFDHSDNNERIFMLYILCAATSKTAQESHYYSQKADTISSFIDESSAIYCDFSFEGAIHDASTHLCSSMIENKSMQGIPIAGILGGWYNQKIVSKINRLAAAKYKKRRLSIIRNPIN